MNKPYAFIFDGKIMEYDSIIELKSELSDEEWDSLVYQTADYYMQFKVVDKSEIELDKNDVRLMRRLKRTLEVIKNLDSALYHKYLDEERYDNYMETIKSELNKLQSEVKISNSSNDNADIIVSRI